MNKKDFIWIIVLALCIVLILSPVFKSLTKAQPYLAGFIKFFLLATMGEILALRIKNKKYVVPSYLLIRALIWGVIGFFVVLAFGVFYSGVGLSFCITRIKFFHALLTSIVMNFTFGIVMMASHNITDKYLELRSEGKKPNTMDAVNAVDWPKFIDFVVFTTIPMFWIPAHTVTFMLPPQFRVFAAALLSILLGLILAFASNRGEKVNEN